MLFSACAGSPTTQDRLLARVIATQPCCLPPSGKSRRPSFAFFEAQWPGPPIPLSTLQATSRDVSCKTEGQDGVAVSFLVGLFHSLQHAGLTRRSLINVRALPDARSRRGVNGGTKFCARPVKPFGRGRSWLRRTRAYANSIGERARIKVYRGCAAEHGPSYCHGQSCLEPKKRGEDGR
jgi:hypothetical protein